MGFMVHDYVNFGFEQAVFSSPWAMDYQVAATRINPTGDKKIVHLHRFPAVVDVNYNVTVEVQGNIPGGADGPGRQGLTQNGVGLH